MADEQDYVGRCIVMLNRHASSLAELTSAEWNDFHAVIKNVEECLKNVLNQITRSRVIAFHIS